MALITQPLRDEHRELLPLLERLRSSADSIDLQSDPRPRIDAALEFLHGHLLPHAAAEEAALYPEVSRLMASELATRTMEVDHAEVANLTRELDGLRSQLTGAPAPTQAQELRRVLYGLYALIKVHFGKEEQVYLPLLDSGLGPDAASAMFTKMEQRAAEARRAP